MNPWLDHNRAQMRKDRILDYWPHWCVALVATLIAAIIAAMVL